MMHLDQLAAFDRVAREGSFSRAALSLGLGQPAVSARILALEEAVGGTLFVRARRIRLTALGESFLPFARRALELVREGTEVARLAQVGERGKVRIGALGSLAGEVGRELARALHQPVPDRCGGISHAAGVLRRLATAGCDRQRRAGRK